MFDNVNAEFGMRNAEWSCVVFRTPHSALRT